MIKLKTLHFFFDNVQTLESQYLGNSTSDHHQNSILKIIFHTIDTPKSEENHLKNHFRTLKSGCPAIATYNSTGTPAKYHLDDSALRDNFGKYDSWWAFFSPEGLQRHHCDYLGHFE